ncbi:hypothetical protein PR048_019479 [Dryococelus australis]|uniref:Uncharacterized protein n=1 Tax=Dryococelus australis TaxID=614101 RepID=A0ABQ9H3K4_9NEOP|nr:hypothetical protein PR048_019479 [Dryococelus australis]
MAPVRRRKGGGEGLCSFQKPPPRVLRELDFPSGWLPLLFPPAHLAISLRVDRCWSGVEKEEGGVVVVGAEGIGRAPCGMGFTCLCYRSNGRHVTKHDSPVGYKGLGRGMEVVGVDGARGEISLGAYALGWCAGRVTRDRRAAPVYDRPRDRPDTPSRASQTAPCVKATTVAERLARSPPTKANRAQSPAESPDFRKWESCRTMPLIGGASRGSPFSLQSPSSALKTSLLRAVQIYSLLPASRGVHVGKLYHSKGAAVAERLACSPSTKANRVQSPTGSPDLREWESCRKTPLVGGSSRDLPLPLPPPLRRRSIFTSIALIGSQDLAVKSRPNLFTVSFKVVQFRMQGENMLLPLT